MSFINKISAVRLAHTFCRIASVQEKSCGDTILIKGWIKNIRKMKKNLFLDINDGSCCKNLQVVAERNENFKPGIGDSVEIVGQVSEAPQGQVELVAKNLSILGSCDITNGYPFTPRQTHPSEYLREYLHLRPKVNRVSSMLRVRHWATKFFHDYLTSQEFLQIHTPILTSNDCEGAGEVFVIKPHNSALIQDMAKENKSPDEAYFDKKVFLSVSGQLALEAITQGLGNTYTFMPAFRAENSRSSLHLAEFYMIEAEMAFVSDISEVTDFIEKLIKSVTKNVFDKCETDVKSCLPSDLANDFVVSSFIDKKWSALTYDEAWKILDGHKDRFQSELKYDDGLSKEHELFLVKHFDGPVFVTEWPKVMKPFYMRESTKDSTKVDAVDLLMPRTGELVGGSLRENDYNRLKSVIPPGLEWYLDLRKFGNVPTGGFGLGFERYLQLITGIHNIRDVIPFPRWPHSCSM